MKSARVSSVTALAIVMAATLMMPAAAALPPPPAAKAVPVTDVYFGTQVVDPYRWMETPTRSPRRAA
jgi:prolyl oligopeptidase